MCAPVLFTLIGVVLIRITAQSLSSDRPVGPYAAGGAHYYRNGLTWTDLVWFFAFGVVFELLAAFFSWRQARTTTHHEQASVRQRADVLWLVTFLAPLVAVAAAGGLALLCATSLPHAPAEVQETGSRLGLWWYSNPDADTLALAFRTTALALCAAFTTTTYIDNVDYHSYEVATGTWLPALTLTVVVALVIFAAHRLEIRDPRHSTAVRAPALYSGITLAVLTQVLRLQTNKTFSIDERVYRFDTDVSFPLSGLLLAFVVGFIPVLLARATDTARATGTTRTTRATRATGTTHTTVSTPGRNLKKLLTALRAPKVAQALRIGLAFLIATPLATGLASVLIETLPLSTPSAAFGATLPYVYNMGVFTMLGSLGGYARSGPVTPPAGDTTHLILSTFSPMNYCLSLVVLAFVVGFAVVWARTGQPLLHARRDRLILPAVITVLGVCLILTDAVKLISTAPVGPYATSGALSYTLTLSWLSVLWFVALGAAIECLARVFTRSARFERWAAKPPRRERRRRRLEQERQGQAVPDFSLLPDVPTGHPDTDPHAAPSSAPAL
ncbi:hypothetical protein DDD63_09530 [Actinobaculum sp. 313]|nr:hypothetical protein DDD63_09530 [Actinobaculum sp. 313]